MLAVDVVNHQKKHPAPVSKIKIAVQSCAKRLRLKHPSITIVLCGTKRMRTVNKKFLSHDDATDVITFDSGDIIICPAIASSNAKHYGQRYEDELLLYVVHGLLHLAGYDDKDEKSIKKMRVMEQKMLKGL